MRDNCQPVGTVRRTVAVESPTPTSIVRMFAGGGVGTVLEFEVAEVNRTSGVAREEPGAVACRALVHPPTAPMTKSAVSDVTVPLPSVTPVSLHGCPWQQPPGQGCWLMVRASITVPPPSCGPMSISIAPVRALNLTTALPSADWQEMLPRR